MGCEMRFVFSGSVKLSSFFILMKCLFASSCRCAPTSPAPRQETGVPVTRQDNAGASRTLDIVGELFEFENS